MSPYCTLRVLMVFVSVCTVNFKWDLVKVQLIADTQ